jgi:hypothetical protein
MIYSFIYVKQNCRECVCERERERERRREIDLVVLSVSCSSYLSLQHSF